MVSAENSQQDKNITAYVKSHRAKSHARIVGKVPYNTKVQVDGYQGIVP